MSKVKVEIRNMSKVYENGDGIQNIDLMIQAGEILTLLGPSGCGKSTILRCLGGFQALDQGRIYIDGQEVTALPPEKRPTSMVFQGYNLWNHMTVYENLAFGLKLRKYPKQEIKQRVHEMLDLLKLPNIEKKYPSELSGGQQQRLALARLLMATPDLILLDEPTSALDEETTLVVESILKDLKKKGKTLIIVTHNKAVAERLADKIIQF